MSLTEYALSRLHRAALLQYGGSQHKFWYRKVRSPAVEVGLPQRFVQNVQETEQGLHFLNVGFRHQRIGAGSVEPFVRKHAVADVAVPGFIDPPPVRDLLADIPDIGWRQFIGVPDVCGGILSRNPGGLFPNRESRACESWQAI